MLKLRVGPPVLLGVLLLLQDTLTNEPILAIIGACSLGWAGYLLGLHVSNEERFQREEEHD